MDDALSEWLGLREAADAAARSTGLARKVVSAIAADDHVSVLDLATGTGANLRYLAPRLPSPQRWLLVDRSATLLSQLCESTSAWAISSGFEVVREAEGCVIRGGTLDCRIETRQMDLGTLHDASLFSGCHLVAASALLDLVSESWLRVLAARCRTAGAAALFTLTYNGHSSCSPEDPEDDMIRNLLNRHQNRDKGLGGPAAGPGAAECAARCFADVGYYVELESSDWTIGAREQELQRQLIDGWAEAATEMIPDAAPRVAAWRGRRLDHLKEGRSRLSVGHHDLGAWLPK